MSESTNLSYFVELRRRLTRFFIVFIGIACLMMPFSNELYAHLALPLLHAMSPGQHLISTSIAGTFIAPLKLVGYLALLLSIPVLLYQIWAFVSPALYPHEKNRIWPLVLVSTLLFYIGVLFAYFVVFPLMFRFFATTAPQGVVLMPDIEQYLGFTLKMFMAFGLTFEVPIITLILVISGITNAKSLAHKRPYIIVGAFTLGMVLTPPDVLSQVLLAVPMWLLFEMGLLLSRFYQKPVKPVVSEEASPAQ